MSCPILRRAGPGRDRGESSHSLSASADVPGPALSERGGYVVSADQSHGYSQVNETCACWHSKIRCYQHSLPIVSSGLVPGASAASFVWPEPFRSCEHHVPHWAPYLVPSGSQRQQQQQQQLPLVQPHSLFALLCSVDYVGCLLSTVPVAVASVKLFFTLFLSLFLESQLSPLREGAVFVFSPAIAFP